MSQTTITRRSALGAGLAGILGAALTPTAAAAPETPAALATVVNADDLAALCRAAWAAYRASRKTWSALDYELQDTLTPEQRRLSIEVSDARTGTNVDETEWLLAELARHLPGLAPAIMALADHIRTTTYQNPGACCTAVVGFEP